MIGSTDNNNIRVVAKTSEMGGMFNRFKIRHKMIRLIGVNPENAEKGISNQLFSEKVISQANLAVVISCDLHMDMDRVVHSKQIGHVHYLHIPALERTKIPDETNHTPMFRVMTIAKDGKVSIDTYAVGETNSRKEHAYLFTLSLQE